MGRSFRALSFAWRDSCTRSMILELPARTLRILAEAYELSPDQPHSGIALLEWLRRTYRWDASTCLYYLAALRRALSGMPPWM